MPASMELFWSCTGFSYAHTDWPGTLLRMPDLTRLLDAAAAGDPTAAADLLPLVYDELRKLAVARMAAEAPGHTLQSTALVHEAYLRIVGGGQPGNWTGRGHFFAAAAEAMRRILVDNARRHHAQKRGGVWMPYWQQPDGGTSFAWQ